MKKLTIMLFSAFLLASCGSDADNATSTNDVEQNEDVTTEETVTEGSEVKENTLQTLPEYETLTDFIDVNQYTVTSQTENKGNRILVFANEQGEKEYKSIFVKNDKRLKIIDLADDHLLFNDILSKEDTSSGNATTDQEKQKDESAEKESSKDTTNKEDSSSKSNQNAELEKYDEYKTIAKEIDLDKYTGKVQTDNKGNRIMLFANENGKNQYKSIFVKRQSRLKIVDFNNDQLLFNDIIK